MADKEEKWEPLKDINWMHEQIDKARRAAIKHWTGAVVCAGITAGTVGVAYEVRGDAWALLMVSVVSGAGTINQMSEGGSSSELASRYEDLIWAVTEEKRQAALAGPRTTKLPLAGRRTSPHRKPSRHDSLQPQVVQ